MQQTFGPSCFFRDNARLITYFGNFGFGLLSLRLRNFCFCFISRRYSSFFLKSDLKWPFSYIVLIHFLLHLNWIYHLDIFKTTNWRKKILPWVGLEPTKVSYLQGRIFVVRFLVQVKIIESPFEINWPLSKTRQ